MSNAKDCLRCGYPAVNTAHEDCCPDGENHITADALKIRYDKLLEAGKLAFGALCGAHAADDSVQGRARRVLRGVLVECGMFNGNAPELSATMETVLGEASRTAAKAECVGCAVVARNFWPAVDGSLPGHGHYAKVVREVREAIANEILARNNPPSQPEAPAKSKRLEIGTHVLVRVDATRIARDWNQNSALYKNRKVLASGHVVNFHNSHGLSYEVEHDDKTVGGYEPHELTPVMGDGFGTGSIHDLTPAFWKWCGLHAPQLAAVLKKHKVSQVRIRSKRGGRRFALVLPIALGAVDHPDYFDHIIGEDRVCKVIDGDPMELDWFREHPVNQVTKEENVKVPVCGMCDDCLFVAANNYDRVRGLRQKPCPACNPNGSRAAPKDREICPDCKRPKARDSDDCRRGDCPKWYAIYDQMAEDDCRQAKVRTETKAPGESPPEICCVCGIRTGMCCSECKNTVVPLCANCKCPKEHMMATLGAKPEWQQRVIAEGLQLHERLKKLREYMNTPAYYHLDDAERGRLARQLVLMNGYYEVLDERIKVFLKPKQQPVVPGDPGELPRPIEALLRIGAQHPTYGQPGDKLVEFTNRILAEARGAVGAVGNDDDAKADWCEAVAAYPKMFGTTWTATQIHATRLTELALQHGWDVAGLLRLCEIARDRLNNNTIYEVMLLEVEESDDLDWLVEQLKSKPKPVTPVTPVTPADQAKLPDTHC